MPGSLHIAREEFEKLLLDYREVKHDLNNAIAVIMALAELSRQNPQHYEQLTSTILARCPVMAQKLLEFQRRLDACLKEDAGGAPPGGDQPAA